MNEMLVQRGEKMSTASTRLTVSAPHERIIVALDVQDQEDAVRLATSLRPHVGLFKVGLELLNSSGLGVVTRLIELGGRIFIDSKLMDIPATVAGASRALTRLGASIFNVHCMGGREMMHSAVEAASNEAARLGAQRPLILGVTVLTSIGEATLRDELLIPRDLTQYVAHLASVAIDAGLDGVIASPHEVKTLRSILADEVIIVTPGVRPAWSQPHDQKRVMTPAAAISSGASYIVVGRPITQPPREIGTPVDAANRIAQEIRSLAG